MRNGIIASFDSVFEGFDALVTPTCPTIAPRWMPPQDRLAELESELDPSKNQMPGVRIRHRDTRPYDFTGHPALTVPCGKSGGLPIGMQLVGRFFDDGLLLRIGYAYQQEVDWQALTTPGA